MASSADTASSPPSAQEITNVSSPSTKGDDALVPASVIPEQSPRKAFVGTQSPRSSAGSDHGGSGNAAEVSPIIRRKKPAWNVPSNSAIEVASVMDTASWPALSESARVSPKSSPSDSLRTLPNGSISALSVSLASSSSAKQPSNNQNLNSTQGSPSFRDKSVKHGAVTGVGSSNSGVANVGEAMSSSLSVLTEASQSLPGKQPSSENFPRGLPNQNNSSSDNERDHYTKTGGFSPHSHRGNDHQRNYAGGRRGSTGHHGNYGNRADGDRGGYEWSHRNIGRGVHMQQLHQQRGVGSYPRAPSVATAPFIAPPPPVRPFSNHMGFPDFQSPIYYVAAPPYPESLKGVPFASHPAPTPQLMYFPAVDPQRAMLLKQIDYYFSPENLCKDLYLRQNMDEQGWVPISLIAGFNRVKQLTNNIPYILDTVLLSNVVEVQGDKIRKRNDWMTWVLHPVDNLVSASGLQSPIANFGLEAHFDNIYLDLDDPKNTGSSGLAKNEAAFARSASVKLNSQISVRNSEDGDVQVGTYSDRIRKMRTLLRSDTM
ncbi:la-related protein 1B-like [Phalaenopsis equestris]|uniref:la-related protein 1B-like n=1 Tax=Phalaenopsis equestris TaxID=78828 RepID=UPI0009E5191B|nr:la-related protein 1B-like [Phalaenopsis equestris]